MCGGIGAVRQSQQENNALQARVEALELKLK